MKFNFSTQFPAKLAEMRALAAELERVEGEIALGKNKSPDLIQAEHLAQERIDNLLPSDLIGFGPEVANVFTEHRKAQLIRTGVVVAVAKLETRRTQLTSKLSRGLADAGQELQRIVTSQGQETVVAGPGAAHYPALEKLYSLSGSLGERVEKFMSLCRELGATIPERKA